MQKGISEEGLEFLTEKSSCGRFSYSDVHQRHVQILCDQTGRDEISGEKFSEQIRKNSTIAQDDTTPSLLGFDVILNSALALPDVFLAKGTQEPWLMDRGLLLKHLQKLQTLGCKKQQV